MEDNELKKFKLVKINRALDLLKNNTSSASASAGIIFDKIQALRHRVLTPTNI